MLFKDIGFDMTVSASTEIIHAHLQKISIFATFNVANFLCMSQWLVLVPDLGIRNSKPYRIFKSPLILLMINHFVCANPFLAKVV